MNLREAERFFKNYDCSNLRMAQERPSDYAAYKRFSLDALENQWRGDEILRYNTLFCSANIPKEHLYGILVRLLNLIQDSCTQEHLLNLLHSIKGRKDNVPADEKPKFAQLLAGNTNDAKLSAIKMAYGCNDLPLCQSYIALCLELLNGVTTAEAERTRKQCLDFQKEYMGWNYGTNRG